MFWPCHRRCPGCNICLDTYSSGSGGDLGLGGSGEHLLACPWGSGEGDGWHVDEDGVLHATSGVVTFLDGPIDELDSVKLSLRALPGTSGGPARIRLKLGILPGGGYVYGDLYIDGSGATLISVGSDEGQLAEVEVGPSGGLGSGSGMHTIGLCYRPPVPLLETSGSWGFYPYEIDADELVWADKDGALSVGETFAASISLVAGATAEIAGEFRVVLPPYSAITGVAAAVVCRQTGGPPLDTVATNTEFVVVVAGHSTVNLAENDLLGVGSFSAIGFGGPGDTIGLPAPALDSDAVNQHGFASVQVKFKVPDDFLGSTAVEVDALEIGFFTLTQNRIPGRLSFVLKIAGSSGAQHWCAVAANPPATSGSLAGVEVLVDDWELDDYDLSYMFDSVGRPGCQVCGACLNLPAFVPNCGSCCSEDAEISASLSIAGFSASSAGCCNKAAGVIILEAPGGSGSAPCLWLYEEWLSCAPSGVLRFFAWAYVTIVNGQCRWEAVLGCLENGSTTVQDPSDPDDNTTANGSVAVYRSEPLDSASCDDFPYTLTRVSSTGDLLITVPLTITLDEAGTEA